MTEPVVRRWLVPTRTYATSFAAQMFALTWLVSGAIVALQLALYEHAAAAEGPLWALAIGAFVTGLSLLAFHERVPPALFAPGMVCGVAAISGAIVLAGGDRLWTSFALYYVWVAVFAFVFFPLVTAVSVSVLSLVGHAAATAWIGTPSVASTLTLAATIVVVGVVVDGLHRSRSASEIDVATGAANVVGLERRLQRTTGDGEVDADLAVAVLDIDGFSRLSATHGSTAADRFLARLADIWTRELDDGDLLAHLRGDRFAVVVAGRDHDGAVATVERLRRATPPSVTCSAGVTLAGPTDTPGMLMRRAEAAVYTAKKAGGDRLVVDGDDPAAARELTLAIERGEMTLLAQPIVDVRTGRIRSFEALVRWDHPERGLVGPGEFIELAERTSLILPLGVAVLDEACSHARRWLDDFPDERLTIAVNVSGRQIDDDGFVETVSSALDRSELPADRLVIEVTESTLASDLGAWRERISAVQALGVSISMDDFGTGYSSLGQLRQLPFETVKIDRSFVSDLPGSAEAEAVISAVTAMARGLGKATVAEGVETVEQFLRMREHGCDRAQGYLFGRPAPIADAGAVIRQQATTERLVRAVADGDPSAVDHVLARARLVTGIEAGASLDEAVKPLLRDLLALGDVESAYLTSIDWTALEQIVLVAENTGGLEIAEGIAFAWADTVCRRALEEGVSHTRDAQQRFPGSDAARVIGIRGYATEPIVLPDGTTFGTLCVASPRAEDVPEQLRSLLAVYSRLIADRIAVSQRPSPPDPGPDGA